MIPYAHQMVGGDDVAAVAEAMRANLLTTGPIVERFERAFADRHGFRHGVAVSSGTAALHCCMMALGILKDDQVIVPAMTFVATANVVVAQGGTPIFADVDPGDLNVTDETVGSMVVRNQFRGPIPVAIAVAYAGQPVTIRPNHGMLVIVDACHAAGVKHECLAQCHSFHPVKHLTTGEGGMVLTDNDEVARFVRSSRQHGMESTWADRAASGAICSEQTSFGLNYRMSELNAALGLSQLMKLDGWIDRRRKIARMYDELLEGSAATPLSRSPQHTSHLYVVRVPGRDEVFRRMREAGIGVNVHYLPVHLHEFYRETHGTKTGDCPVAEKAYEEILSLPMWPGLADDEVELVARNLMKCIGR